MSRIGNRILQIPEGVTVEEKDGNITVTGPKGTLTMPSSDKVKLSVEDNQLKITRDDDKNIAMHGTINALINNMITGVTKGYEKTLEIVGVGYRFNVQGNKIVIAAGYSHPVEMIVPEGIKAEVKDQTQLILTGIDKQQIGEFAANVRKVRPPEPYKGKGIRYSDERIRRKEGKKAA